MNSIEQINFALDYIEQNIGDEIDEKIVTSIVGCSFSQYQRTFSFMTGISLYEYVRNRRLSLSAIELKHTQQNIIDVGVKYGYKTASGFSRAFKGYHNATPSEIMNGEKEPRLFDRLFFISPQYSGNKAYRFEKEKLKMARINNIEFKKFPAYKVVGKSIATKMMSNDIPMLWGRFFSDGSYETLMELCKDESNKTTLADAYTGIMYNFQEDGKITYLVGLIFPSSVIVPDGFDCFTIPAGMIAESQITGEEYEIYSQGHELTVTAIENEGYKVDCENFFQCEVYTDERFNTPKNSGETVVTLDYYMPIK